jgi:hypothetical protein
MLDVNQPDVPDLKYRAPPWLGQLRRPELGFARAARVESPRACAGGTPFATTAVSESIG